MKGLFKDLAVIRNKDYINFKSLFLVHSNGIEGSTFSFAEMTTFLNTGFIEGSHSIEDVNESVNSSVLYDFVMKTLDKPLTERLICEMNSIILHNTRFSENNMTGKYKTIPNKISGSNVELSLPWEVPDKIRNLLAREVNSIEDVAKFHVDFEQIHPFVDGNGRIGRMIVLKQCIERDMIPPLITKENSMLYKKSLEHVQLTGDYSKVIDVFVQAQKDMEKNTFYNNVYDTHKLMLENDQQYRQKAKN